MIGKGPAMEFLTTWWWGMIAVPAIAANLYFVGHALMSIGKSGFSRILWAIGMLFAGPLVAPFYWWKFSDAK